MKKLFPILVLLGACAPDIASDPVPGEAIIVNFDPAAATPVVPLPNDLALRTGVVVVPPSPTDTPAQKEFNEQYLGKLSGFPFESTGSVTVSGDLKPETVNPQTILALDITDPKAPAPVQIAPVYADKKISIPPPAGGWKRAHKYAVAAIGGASGLRGAAGQDVIGSQTWALVSSSNPLVTCTDLTAPDCEAAVDVIPSEETDPEARLKDETAKALQLEQLRLGYKPILDALGKPRAEIPIVWTFTIVDAGEVTFDPANKVIPFPNDVLRDPTTGKIKLPNPKTGAPLTDADCAAAATANDSAVLLYCGLNTLDGFSTLAPPVSENSDKEGALAQGDIDATSLTPMNVGMAKLASKAPASIQTQPKWTPCINCLSSLDAAGKPQTSPQQLQWKLDAPLDEKTTYFSYVTGTVRDSAGKQIIANPVFALVRSSASLVTPEGKSAVSIITDDQAKQLEPLRAAMAPAFDGLDKAGVKRADIALAFPFTTQSESTILDQLYGVPALAKAAGVPDYPIVTQKATAQYTGAATASSIPIDGIQDFYAGAFLTPVSVTGPGGTLNPKLETDPKSALKTLPVQWAIAIPKGTAPANGWPITIYGHGIHSSRNQFLASANALAKAGQAVFAFDSYFHGERSSCTGAKAVIPVAGATDDYACQDPTTMKCDEGFQGLCVLRVDASRQACVKSATDPFGDGGCVAAGQGRCAADDKCQGAGAGLARDASQTPKISGWNVFSLTNFFATRDNFRQHVIDFAQVASILKSADPKRIGQQITAASVGAGGGPVALDGAKINFMGVSLGAMLGTLATSASPDVSNAMFNVSGGALTSIILQAPAFAAERTALLAGLATLGYKPGTPSFDQFIATVQWILDEADPANMAYRVTHPIALNANRKAFIQFIQGDQTIPNYSTLTQLVGANRSFAPTPPGFGCVAPLYCYEFTEKGDGFDETTAPAAKRHEFLFNPPSATSTGLALTTKAQTQAATFIATGALP